MALTILIYKHVVNALRKAKLIDESKGEAGDKSSVMGIMIVASVILITGILVALVLKGVI